MEKFFKSIKIGEEVSFNFLLKLIMGLLLVLGYTALTFILLDVGDVDLLSIDFSSIFKIISMIFLLLLSLMGLIAVFLLVIPICFRTEYFNFFNDRADKKKGQEAFKEQKL